MAGHERQASGADGPPAQEGREKRAVGVEERAEGLERQANGGEDLAAALEGHERQAGGGEERRTQTHGERKRRGRDGLERLHPEDGDREQRRGLHHRGGSRPREPQERGYGSLSSTNRKKKRIEEKEMQATTIFVGDLDPDTTAEQLTVLFRRFGRVVSSKIKENHCYGFVTFEKREAAESAIAAGQHPDGIELLNGKQVYVSWALGSLPEWKKGIGGFVVSPGKDLLHGHRARKGVVKPSVLAAATAAAAAKAHAVLASSDKSAAVEPRNDFRGRAIVAYDDLL